MSWKTVRQLHTDLDNVRQTTKKTGVDAGVCNIFNANLQEAKKAHPNNVIISAIMSADGNTLLDDLLVRTGQLMATLEEEYANENPPSVF
jgi:hypothetical protein